jgi:hypothetical protein
MEIAVKVTRRDFWQFFKFAMVRKPSFRDIVLKFSALIIALFFVIVFGMRNTFGLNILASLLLTLLAALLAILIGTLLQSWVWRLRILKLSPDKPRLFGKYSLAIDGEGLHVKSNLNEGFNAWRDVWDITEAGDYIFIFVDQHLAHIVPKRAFKSPNDAYDFLHLIKLFWQSAHV